MFQERTFGWSWRGTINEALCELSSKMKAFPGYRTKTLGSSQTKFIHYEKSILNPFRMNFQFSTPIASLLRFSLMARQEKLLYAWQAAKKGSIFIYRLPQWSYIEFIFLIIYIFCTLHLIPFLSDSICFMFFAQIFECNKTTFGHVEEIEWVFILFLSCRLCTYHPSYLLL